MYGYYVWKPQTRGGELEAQSATTYVQLYTLILQFCSEQDHAEVELHYS